MPLSDEAPPPRLPRPLDAVEARVLDALERAVAALANDLNELKKKRGEVP